MLIGEPEDDNIEQQGDEPIREEEIQEIQRHENVPTAMLREFIQQQINAQEQNRELLLQGLANLTEASTEIRTHTSTLQQGLINAQEAILQQLSTFSLPNIQGAPSSTVSHDGNSNSNNTPDSETSTPTANMSRVILTHPEVPPRFRDTSSYNPVTFIKDLEKYFKKSNTPDIQKLETVIDNLEGPAKNWATIYRRVWHTFDDFRTAFLQTYWSQHEQSKLRNRIISEVWSNRYTMSDHFAYFVSMAEQLTDPFPENELVSHLIRHFPTHLQALWALTQKHTLTDAADFIRQQENIVTYRNTPVPTKSKAPRPVLQPTTQYNPYRTSNAKQPNQRVNAIQFVPSTNASGNGNPSSQ